MNYTLYTDGAFSSLRNQGGVGIIFLKEEELILEYSKTFKNTSNNQMELLAIILGLKMIKHPIESLTIVTDSGYCIGCATQGWKRSKNTKLWEEFDRQYLRVQTLCPNIIFEQVKGHSTNYWNNKVDRLAVLASQSI